MNPLIATVLADVALVSIITPASILASSYLQLTSVERNDINRFVIAVKMPKAVVFVSLVPIMVYTVEWATWWQYLALTFTPLIVAIVELAMFTPEVDQWTDLRETYLFYEGDGDWIDDWVDGSS